ncbi:MAG: hypothetical protein IJO13_04210 [Lachnospiraceae bacterium]|nr:hypothetical protein [Lachnospiraceae bacterium]
MAAPQLTYIEVQNEGDDQIRVFHPALYFFLLSITSFLFLLTIGMEASTEAILISVILSVTGFPFLRFLELFYIQSLPWQKRMVNGKKKEMKIVFGIRYIREPIERESKKESDLIRIPEKEFDPQKIPPYVKRIEIQKDPETKTRYFCYTKR